MKKRIALVSCVKTKQQHAVAASEMYISPLFQGMRRYAENYADAWYILSAKYGLLRPDDRISPYEHTLNNMPKHERSNWGELVKQQLNNILTDEEVSVVLLAGKRYREPLMPFLQEKQISIDVPMYGLPFGRQLCWLKEH